MVEEPEGRRQRDWQDGASHRGADLPVTCSSLPCFGSPIPPSSPGAAHGDVLRSPLPQQGEGMSYPICFLVYSLGFDSQHRALVTSLHFATLPCSCTPNPPVSPITHQLLLSPGRSVAWVLAETWRDEQVSPQTCPGEDEFSMGAGHAQLAPHQPGFPGSNLSVGDFVSCLLPARALHTWRCRLVAAGGGYEHRSGHAPACVPGVRPGMMENQGVRGSTTLYISCYQAGRATDLCDHLAQCMTMSQHTSVQPRHVSLAGWVCSVSLAVLGKHCISRNRHPSGSGAGQRCAWLGEPN